MNYPQATQMCLSFSANIDNDDLSKLIESMLIGQAISMTTESYRINVVKTL
jgi:hypothetical protein